VSDETGPALLSAEESTAKMMSACRADVRNGQAGSSCCSPPSVSNTRSALKRLGALLRSGENPRKGFCIAGAWQDCVGPLPQ
jgi:hypothetical protein